MDKITKIEIDFPVPVEFPEDWYQKLSTLVDEVCAKYEKEHPGRVMWPASHGSKMTFMPMTQAEEKERGCEFDDGIYHIGVSEREDYEK